MEIIWEVTLVKFESALSKELVYMDLNAKPEIQILNWPFAALHEMCQKIILTVRQIPGTGNNF